MVQILPFIVGFLLSIIAGFIAVMIVQRLVSMAYKFIVIFIGLQIIVFGSLMFLGHLTINWGVLAETLVSLMMDTAATVGNETSNTTGAVGNQTGNMTANGTAKAVISASSILVSSSPFVIGFLIGVGLGVKRRLL
jgi:uncharacterized membrane protein (Fun14 family)